jgi:hypothetical protein
LKKEGLTNAEVASKVGCSAKTVSRYWNEWTQHGQNLDTKICPPSSTIGQNMDINGTQVMSHEGSSGQNVDTTGTEDLSIVDYTKDFVF